MSPLPNSIAEIKKDSVKQKLLSLKNNDYILGFFLQGSKVTGFGAPDADWDIFIYCTDEYYNTLDYDTLTEYTFEGAGKNKKLVGDYAFVSDQIFKQQLNSPMDIDHIQYKFSHIIWDRLGELSRWVEKLATFPESEYEDKVKLQLVQLSIAFGYAKISKIRNRLIDMRVNLNRVLTIAFSYWFTLNKSWVPQLKWWTDHVKRLGMADSTFEIYENAITNPDYDNIEKLVEHLKTLTKTKGVHPNPHEDFYSTLMTHGRLKYIKFSYF
ncbi:MAG: DUF4037 domain-containing protein [Candidatus Heimdallarchaeota archaeon]|nr:DUF4037 domain-containing protein [Candidatus Heimdallarchaeota archaeon]